MNSGFIYSLRSPFGIISGPNSIKKIAEQIKKIKAEKVTIITDEGVRKAGLIDRPLQLLKSEGLEVTVFDKINPEPEAEYLQKMFSDVKATNCDLLIGMGGGSSMDAAKLFSVMFKNDHNIKEMIGIEKIENKGIPVIMIPTTAGTGSEVTQNAIVTIPEKEFKVGIVSEKLIPDCVILDPVLTVDLPSSLTASTGVDAFTHAIECYISKKANPLSDMFALRSIHLIYRSIQKAYENGKDIDARHDMLLGSMLGGLCIASSGTAAVHALAYPLGGKYGVSHGVSNAMLLPHVMKFNMDAIEKRLYNVAFEMGINTQKCTIRECAEEVVESLFSMVKDLNIPACLEDLNIYNYDIDCMAEAAGKVKRLLDNNPKQMSVNDIKHIYSKIT